MKKKRIKSSDRVFETLAAAANALGVEIDLLKQAKKLGCPNFRQGGRIHCKNLNKWIADHSKELQASGDKLSLRDQKTNQEIRKLKILNDAKERALVPRDAVMRAISTLSQGIIPLLDQKLENEYPAMVSGLDVAGARVFGKRLNDSIKQEIQKFSKVFEI